jgi:hypothetical protein
VVINLFTVLKKLKECVGFFFFNNLIATNVLRLGGRFNAAKPLL